MSNRIVAISDFLTEEQINRVVVIYRSTKGTGRTAREIRDKVIEPNLHEINNKLGQMNDPLYLAYACESALTLAEKNGGS